MLIFLKKYLSDLILSDHGLMFLDKTAILTVEDQINFEIGFQPMETM